LFHDTPTVQPAALAPPAALVAAPAAAAVVAALVAAALVAVVAAAVVAVAAFVVADVLLLLSLPHAARIIVSPIPAAATPRTRTLTLFRMPMFPLSR